MLKNFEDIPIHSVRAFTSVWSLRGFRCLAWLISLTAVGPLFAADTPVTSANVQRIGFHGTVKVGMWAPFSVGVETSSPCQGRLELEAVDPDGNRAIWSKDFSFPSAGSHAVSLLFKVGRLNVNLRSRLVLSDASGEQSAVVPVESGENPHQQLRQSALKHAVLLVGTYGDPGGVAEDSRNLADSPDDNRPRVQLPVHVVNLADPSEFIVAGGESAEAVFKNAVGMEAIDTMIVSGRFDLDPHQSDALKTWVELGGHLIVSVGADLGEFRSSPLSEWLSPPAESSGPVPFRITDSATFLRLDTLESFAGKNAAQILINRRQPVEGIKIEPGNSAQTLLSVLSGPLIVRSPYGMGTVTLIGLSLSEPPIQNWSSLPRVVSKLLWDVKRPTAENEDSQTSQLAYSGISEFSTQLHTALLRFPEVRRLSTWAIIGLMAAYLLLIGPVDYFFVHRVFGRPKLTWLTFPVLIGLAAVLAAWMARSRNGETLMMSQVDVLDIDVSTQTARARIWASLYSPRSERYQVVMQPLSLRKENSLPDGDAGFAGLTWSGIPETTFGGMYREGGQQIQPPKYRIAASGAGIDNLPIPVWGSKTLAGEWSRSSVEVVESQLESPRLGQLRGTIRHRFPVPITDWFLAYNTRVFLPRVSPATGEADPWLPNSAWPPNDPAWERVKQREIGGYLTRTVARQFVRSDPSNKKIQGIRMDQQPFEPLAEGHEDPLGEIVRVLTFHRQIGGKTYTGLDNFALRGMDFSDRLGLNQAVLFGRIDLPASEIRIQDHEPEIQQRETFIRIVLPVEHKHIEKTPFNVTVPN